MSLILDALRKMEEERKARKGGTVDIRPEILAPRRQRTKVKTIAVTAAVLVVAGLGAGYLLKGKTRPVQEGKPSEQLASRAAQPEPIASPAENRPSPPESPAIRQTEPPGQPSAPQAVPNRNRPQTLPSPPVAVPPPAGAAAAPAAGQTPGMRRPMAPQLPGGRRMGAAPRPNISPQLQGQKNLRPSLPTAPAAAAPAPTPEPARPVEASQPAPPSSPTANSGGELKISGIAWNDERRLRRAVVNGELVKEGSEIAGARVVAIGENRVRFSRGGSSFEVTYSPGFGGRP